MSIRPRWSIRSFLCYDALQHQRTPLHASSSLLQRPVPLSHGYWQYSSAAYPTAGSRHCADRRPPLNPRPRPKLDDNTVKEEEAGHAAVKGTRQSDERTQEATHAEFHEHQLEELLPTSLRERDSAQAQKLFDPAELIKILSNAQSDPRGSINLLSRLVLVHNRLDAALFFVDRLLDYVAAWNSVAVQPPPCTLAWPKGLSVDGLREPVELQKPAKGTELPTQSLKNLFKNLPNSEASGLAEVWQFLGYLIVGSSNVDSVGEASKVMSLVYQTLAKLHHRGLVPDSIYDWENSLFSSTVQRSPILYLLSSRILSTLSDATWRSYQDEAISRGEQLGISYRTQDPPGGRFRLKVRELGPETWLEFVLWCCVESNCSQAGANIVSLLAEQQSDPWFTSSWTSNADQGLTIKLDWDRAKSRPGGVVGRVEGYSYDNPLAQLPSRTISVEVIIAIIESSVDAVSPTGGSYSQSISTLQTTIERLLAFLRPQRLPRDYIEYISARLFSAVAPNVLGQPQALVSLTQTIAKIRALSTSSTKSTAPTEMGFDSIIRQSQLYAGLLQVLLHAHCCRGEVRKAISIYDQIQEMVDHSKMQAITSFLALTPDSGQQRAPSSSNKDFVMSHGQLPLFKIASFLDLLTENNVTSLSDWLIYSTDVDGPLIPMSAFSRIPVASALIRYAGANNDLQLLQYVMTAIRGRKLKPPVTLLRWEANAYMQCSEFRSAAACLKALKPIVAGGFHPDNLACLAACILRLEAGYHNKGHPHRPDTDLADAVELMRDILRGQHDCNSGDFDIVQKQLFKQQISYLLKICDSLSSSKLNLMASSFERKFPSSNTPALQPRTFNILLHGLVEVMGAAEGVRVWDQFCQAPILGRYDSPLENDAVSDSNDSPSQRDSNDDGDDKSSLFTEHATLSEDDAFGALDLFHAQSRHNVRSDTNAGVASNILLGDTSFHDFISVSSSAQSETEFIDENSATMKEPCHNPVVIPTLRSLMIIVNKALSEATAPATATDGPSSARAAQRATSLLQSSWMRDRFLAFGVEDEYEDLVKTLGETSGFVREWYPTVRMRDIRQQAAAEKASTVSDLFSGVGRVLGGPSLGGGLSPCTS